MANLVINGFNIGQDLSVQIQDDQNNSIDVNQLGLLMDFEASQEDTELTVIPISNGGIPLFDTLPHGFSGRMTFTRVNGALDNLIAAIQGNFYQLGLRQKFQINCQVANRDGTIDQYIFTEVSLSKGTFGTFQADKEVTQTLSFRAQQLLNSSGVNPPIGATTA